jgi:hypothetical protein
MIANRTVVERLWRRGPLWHPESMRPPRVARAAFKRLSPRTRSAVLHRFGYFAPWEEGFDFTPPALGAGEVAGPPDFVGVGVQKAGTSWWYELIADHPDVSTREGIHKERHYLTRFATQAFGDEEMRRYHGWFPRGANTLTGEWTPDYLGYPWVAPVLARAAPLTKLLILLRDPVERFRSGLSFRLSQGATDGVATVADAVRQGFYARGIRHYLDYFPPEQVLVLQYERCVADPRGQLASTYCFLGLSEFEPDDLRRSVNASGTKVSIDDGARQRLIDLYAPDVKDLATLLPDIDLSLWPNFASGCPS